MVVLLLALVVYDPSWAQNPSPDSKKKAPPENANLERRIAELEDAIQKLSKELQVLRAQTTAPAVSLSPLGKTTVCVYTLKRCKAADAAKALQELFPAKDGLTIRIACHLESNTVLARGNREELMVIEAILSKLEDIPQTPGNK